MVELNAQEQARLNAFFYIFALPCLFKSNWLVYIICRTAGVESFEDFHSAAAQAANCSYDGGWRVSMIIPHCIVE